SCSGFRRPRATSENDERPGDQQHEDHKRADDKAPVTPGAFLLGRCFLVRHFHYAWQDSRMQSLRERNIAPVPVISAGTPEMHIHIDWLFQPRPSDVLPYTTLNRASCSG